MSVCPCVHRYVSQSWSPELWSVSQRQGLPKVAVSQAAGTVTEEKAKKKKGEELRAEEGSLSGWS